MKRCICLIAGLVVLAALTPSALALSFPPALSGDFNGNGEVDAADYSLWANGTSPLENEASFVGMGTTDATDYTDWRAHFGQKAVYWDIDGATPGAGGSAPFGTWDAAGGSNWSTSAAGDVATGAWLAGDAAVFSAGTDATDPYIVTVTGSPVASGLTVQEGQVVIAALGGAANQINVGSNPVLVKSGAILQIGNLNFFGVAAGQRLILDGGEIRNTITGVGSGIWSGTASAIVLSENGGTINTPNGGGGQYSIMVFTGTGGIVRAPGAATATLVKKGFGEYRAQTGNFTTLDVQEGLFRINGTGGTESGFGAATGTVMTAGGAVANNYVGTALGTSITITSPATRSFVLGNSLGADTIFVLNALWTINGNISGPGGLMLNGWTRADTNALIGSQTQNLTLGGTNTYGGATTINFGTIATTSGNAIPDTSTVDISTNSTWGVTVGVNTAVLRVDASETIGALNGGNSVRGSVNINGAGVTLTTGDNDTTTTYSGTITGTGSLAKTGSGTFTMDGVKSYTGNTSVLEGILSTNSASLADAADVLMTTGGIFDLNFGATDTIDQLFFDNVAQAIGTWGSLTSGATNTSAFFTGAGILNVTAAGAGAFAGVPEPATMSLVLMGLAGMMGGRRRR